MEMRLTFGERGSLGRDAIDEALEHAVILIDIFLRTSCGARWTVLRQILIQFTQQDQGVGDRLLSKLGVLLEVCGRDAIDEALEHAVILIDILLRTYNTRHDWIPIRDHQSSAYVTVTTIATNP